MNYVRTWYSFFNKNKKSDTVSGKLNNGREGSWQTGICSFPFEDSECYGSVWSENVLSEQFCDVVKVLWAGLTGQKGVHLLRGCRVSAYLHRKLKTDGKPGPK